MNLKKNSVGLKNRWAAEGKLLLLLKLANEMRLVLSYENQE